MFREHVIMNNIAVILVYNLHVFNCKHLGMLYMFAVIVCITIKNICLGIGIPCNISLNRVEVSLSKGI